MPVRQGLGRSSHNKGRQWKASYEAAGHPDSKEEKVQWENRIAELRKKKDAVLQGQVWATSSNHLGGTGVQRGEVGINGPGLQGGAKATLPSRDVTRGMDSSFFDD